MESPAVERVIDDLVRTEGTTRERVLKEALRAFLQEKKRAVQSDQLDILRRYGAASATALEEKIRRGEIGEMPAWEDRIALDHLAEAVRRIEDDLAAL